MIPVATLIAAASLYWGAVAPTAVKTSVCTGHVTYLANQPQESDDIIASVMMQENDTAMYPNLPAWTSDCIIRLPRQWRGIESNAEACGDIVHEYGHAIGLTHEAPYKIMAPDDSYVPKFCRRFKG